MNLCCSNETKVEMYGRAMIAAGIHSNELKLHLSPIATVRDEIFSSGPAHL